MLIQTLPKKLFLNKVCKDIDSHVNGGTVLQVLGQKHNLKLGQKRTPNAWSGQGT